METTDIAIIGGGIAGLSAACEAARAGRQTSLFETTPDLGGRAQTRLQHGFAFNRGPHALFAKGALRQALKDFGVKYSAQKLELTTGKILWGEELHPLLVSAASLLSLTPLSWRDRAQLTGVMTRIGKGTEGEPGTPLRTYTAKLRPKVATVVELMVRLSTYANAPEEIDAQAGLRQLAIGAGGVYYVDGGWQTIICGLAEVASAAGAQLHPGTSAQQVECVDGSWQIHLNDGRLITAKSLILAVPPAECTRLLPQLAEAVAALTPVRAVCLDLALSSLPVPTNNFVLGANEPLYFSVHSKTANLAPPGGALIHAAYYLAPNEAPAKSHLDRLERLVDQMQPGWRPLEIARQRLMGIHVAQCFPRFDRPPPRLNLVAPAPLFIAGDWLGGDAMLSDASAATGRAAARRA